MDQLSAIRNNIYRPITQLTSVSIQFNRLPCPLLLATVKNDLGFLFVFIYNRELFIHYKTTYDVIHVLFHL